PDRDARRAILAIHTRARPLASNVSLDALARRTNGFSGADREAICRRAASLALAEWLRASGAGDSGNEPRALSTAASGRALVIESRHFEAAIREAQERGQ